MNGLEKRVKWELVAGLLVVIVIMATFMFCSEKEKASSAAVDVHCIK